MTASRFSLNQASIKHAGMADAVRAIVDAGIPAIGAWREPVAEYGLERSAALIRDAGLRVSSLCRGGFFTVAEGPARRAAIDDNRAAIAEAHALGAPTLVLVVGGLPEGSRDLVGARSRVADAIGELVPEALDAGVSLGIEALHPMYAADRAVVNSLRQALDLAAPFPAEAVGVVVDTFHLWWDADLASQVARAGTEGRIVSYQVCDWLTPIAADPLLSRGYLGDGHIDFEAFTRLVDAAGFTGDIECELFNADVWAAPFDEVARTALERYEQLVAPHLS